MVWIPPGEFVMGSPETETEAGRNDDETQHRVRLTRGFWMGKYEVTQEQWERVIGSNPSEFKGAKNPVENVPWDECQEFIKKLNAQVKDGGFRLPTEAEWEYACRAGTAGAFAGKPDAMGWYLGNSGNMTYPVGLKRPNDWGRRCP